jgi:hypothetical protein
MFAGAEAQQHERHHTPEQHVQERRQHRSLPSSTAPATLRIEQPQKAAPTGTIGLMHPTHPPIVDRGSDSTGSQRFETPATTARSSFGTPQVPSQCRPHCPVTTTNRSHPGVLIHQSGSSRYPVPYTAVMTERGIPTMSWSGERSRNRKYRDAMRYTTSPSEAASRLLSTLLRHPSLTTFTPPKIGGCPPPEVGPARNAGVLLKGLGR